MPQNEEASSFEFLKGFYKVWGCAIWFQNFGIAKVESMYQSEGNWTSEKWR
jgi:hypothetical protein